MGHEGLWQAPDPIAGRIQRVTLDGVVSDVATALPGAPPNRPNDLCFGPDGLLYYTDPHWEDLANLGTGRVGRTTLDAASSWSPRFPPSRTAWPSAPTSASTSRRA